MELRVALETSTRQPSVAVALGSEVREVKLGESRAHASDLLPALEGCLREVGGEPGDIDAVFVGLGPGSYTGLRVGISTALGLSIGTRADVVGVGSGEVLAYGVLRPLESVVQVLDARQGEVYFARFERTADDVRVVEEPCVLTLEEARGRLRRDERVLADAGAIERLGADAAGFEVGGVPSARALLELGERRLEVNGASDRDALEPLYLRPFRAKTRRR